MENLKDYKKRLTQIFFMSVDKDIEKWENEYSEIYKSPCYNGYYFIIKYETNQLIVKQYNRPLEFVLSNFNFLFDNKVWVKYRKIKKHFDLISKEKIKIKDNKTYREDLDFLIGVLNGTEDSFVKEIRKTKLKKLK